ncbi:MAG: hypothetical protein H7343_13845 [Undibacterium sp.]|nr:hypothetical protein [Opitutaceae bacterium]
MVEAPATLTPKFLPVQARLEQFLGDNPDLKWIIIRAVRQGWVVNGVLPFTDPRRRNGVISIEREATRADLEHWADKAGFVEGPQWSPRGTFLTVAEPVLSPPGRMLGWLVLKVGSYQIRRVGAPARLLMCLTVAMGSIVAVGFLLVRARDQAHGETESQTAAALAADKLKPALLAHVSHELRTPAGRTPPTPRQRSHRPRRAPKRRLHVRRLSRPAHVPRRGNRPLPAPPRPHSPAHPRSRLRSGVARLARL